MSSDNTNTFIYSILDAARIFGELETAQTLQPNFLSLYTGESEKLLRSVAPYFLLNQPESEFGKWLLEKGWGNSWGIFVEAAVTFEEMRKHFRKFLLVKTEDGKELYFRFYDPRVLRIFLPTCDEHQFEDFFGPVKQFICEDEDPAFALLFSLNEKQLVTERIEVDKIFTAQNEFTTNNSRAVEAEPVNKPKRKLFFD